MRFRDRTEAGQRLAEMLTAYANRLDVLVLGLPRGGVPVAFEIARALRVSLDVFIVRKLGLPMQPELAVGAIATSGVRVLNEAVVHALNLSPKLIDTIAAVEERELEKRELAYRGHSAAPQIEGKTILLVDDGVATGSTMRAAVQALKKQHPARLVIGVPTAPPSSYNELRRLVDEMVALMTPADFFSVSQWYECFSQTTDEEVSRLLKQARHNLAVPETVAQPG